MTDIAKHDQVGNASSVLLLASAPAGVRHAFALRHDDMPIIAAYVSLFWIVPTVFAWDL